MNKQTKPKSATLAATLELIPDAAPMAPALVHVADNISREPVVARKAFTAKKEDPNRRKLLTPEETCALQPSGEKLTIWKNPTPKAVKFEIYVAPPMDLGKSTTQDGTETQRLQPAKWCIVHVAPGGRVTLPTEYDHAITDVRKIGGHAAIVGGLAPQLVKMFQETQP